MNILPKKSWHVRNKDNVARVRRDEAKALEEERELAKRKAFAEQEARIKILRQRAEESVQSSTPVDSPSPVWDLPQEPECTSDSEPDEPQAHQEEPTPYEPINTAHPSDKHINLFEDFEKRAQGSNKEYEAEKKREQDNYEKKIGYLTFLGQSAAEALGEKPWYEKAPKKMLPGDSKLNFSAAELLRAADPLLSIKGYLDKKKDVEDRYYGKEKGMTKRVEKQSANKTAEIQNQRGSSQNIRRRERLETEQKRSRSRSPRNTTRVDETQSGESSSKEKKTPKLVMQREANKSLSHLREQRLQREAEEKRRSLELIARLQGYHTPINKRNVDERNLSYNSVFNPQIHHTHR